MDKRLTVDHSREEKPPAEFQPYDIGEYTLKAPLTSNKSGFSKWGFCWKGDTEFFIKEFLSPVYPDDSVELSAVMREKRIDECVRWFDAKSRIYNTIVQAQTGNLVVPISFFKYESRFYLVTQKVSESAMDFAVLNRFDMAHKLIVMKVLANSFARLAERNIVHADVKPDNLLIKQTNGGFFTMKIIDFDASYLADMPPEPDEVQGDTVYYAPETLLYIIGEPAVLSPKVDVFAMGIIFHQVLTGKMPVIKPEYDYIYEAVLSGDPPVLEPSLPAEYKRLLENMLQKDPKDRLTMQQVFDELVRLDAMRQAAEKAAPPPVRPVPPAVTPAVPAAPAAPPAPPQAGFINATDDDLW
ncbi:MAG: protein kinase [Oscillospiraceae bacterium]|nr:protein kinase [Oscillospiraceae bacterium]